MGVQSQSETVVDTKYFTVKRLRTLGAFEIHLYLDGEGKFAGTVAQAILAINALPEVAAIQQVVPLTFRSRSETGEDTLWSWAVSYLVLASLQPQPE